MAKKIFQAVCLVAALVLVCSTAVLMAVLYGHFDSQIQKELQTEAAYIARGLEVEPERYLEGLTDRSRRVTIIQSDGTVTFDNTADPAAMENHSAREEVREALASGTGAARRLSATLAEQTYYYAVTMADGSVLRLAATQRSVLALLMDVMQPVALVVVLALVLCAVLARRVAGRIVAPINRLDLENPERNEAYEELSPLLSNIARLRRTIDHQLEQAGKRQQEFHLITEHMSEGLLVLDATARLLSWNGAALRLLGQEQTREGANSLTLNRSEAFRSVVEQSLMGHHSEALMEHDDQTLQLMANPVLQDGIVSGAVVLVVDVTERAQREQLRREFSANVSHELKTPLTSISGFAELMKSGLVKQQDVPDLAGSIYEEAQRLIHLIEDIIRLSALDEGTASWETAPVELLALTGVQTERLRPLADSLQVQLTVAGDPAVITGNPQILGEIVYNLCENAIKYNRPGGTVAVTVSDGEAVTLQVRDTGIGIPSASQPRVFERFYRVDKSHSSQIGGTGLGLSIVKHGAAFHNAQVQLESTEGKGTTVTVVFPKK